MTIEQLAERAGLDATYLGGIERGGENPSLKVLIAISKALGLPLQALVAVAYEGETTDGLRAMMQSRIAGMSADELRLALQLLDAVVTR